MLNAKCESMGTPGNRTAFWGEGAAPEWSCRFPSRKTMRMEVGATC